MSEYKRGFELEWETLDPERIDRARVHGGWLVRSVFPVEGICFVPDPEDEWKLKRTAREEKPEDHD